MDKNCLNTPTMNLAKIKYLNFLSNKYTSIVFDYIHFDFFNLLIKIFILPYLNLYINVCRIKTKNLCTIGIF
jgi:hypothetical protein